MISFYSLFGKIFHISGRIYLLAFGLATAQRLFTSLTESILFLCRCKSFNIVIYLGDIFILICSNWAGKRHNHFCVLNWFFLDYILIFPSLTFASLRLWGVCWDTVNMPLSLPPDKLADVHQLAFSLLPTQPVAVHHGMFLLGKANICANAHSQLFDYVMSFRVTC